MKHLVWLFALLLLSVPATALEQEFARNLIDPFILNPTLQPPVLIHEPTIKSFPFQPRSPLFHDLSVDVFRYEAAQGIKVGDAVTLIGSIRNSGAVATRLNYAFFVNDQNLGPVVVPSPNRFYDNPFVFLQPGETRVVVKSIQLEQEGGLIMQLRADPFNILRETRENNNTRSIRILVRSADAQDQPAENNNQNNQQNNDQQNNNQNNTQDQQNQNNQNNQQNTTSNSGSRSEARYALYDAQNQCDAAETTLARAEQDIASGKAVLFGHDDVEKQDDAFKEAKRELRDAERAYNRDDFAAAEILAVSVEEDCDQIARKFPAALQTPSQSIPSYAVSYQQSADYASTPEPIEEVTLIQSPTKQKTATENSETGVTGTSWLITGIIITSFLLLGELGALAYLIMKK